MTINEAIQKGIQEVHIKPWSEYARMIVPAAGSSIAKIIDPAGNITAGREPEEAIYAYFVTDNKIKNSVFPQIDPSIQQCEQWVRPSDYFDKFPIPKKKKNA